MYVKLLHCWRSLFAHASCTTNCLCNLIKERFTLEFISESGCKGNHFLYLLPNFIKTFFEVFSRKVFKKVLLEGFLQQTVRRVFSTLSFLPRFLFQYVNSYACFPVEAGAKVRSLYVHSKSFYLFFTFFSSI